MSGLEGKAGDDFVAERLAPYGLTPELYIAARPFLVNLGTHPTPDYDVYIGRDFAGRSDEGFGNIFKLTKDNPMALAQTLWTYWVWCFRPLPWLAECVSVFAKAS